MTISAKQQAFVDEYLKCRNAAEAARRAGYAERSARQLGQRLLTKDDIAAQIAERAAESAMEADEVLHRLASMSRGSMEDFISFNEQPYPTFTLDLAKAQRRGVLHLIKKLKYNAEGYPEIELHNPQTALELIGKHHKLFAEKLDVHHSGLTPFSADEAAEAEQELDEWQPTFTTQNGHG